MVTQRPDAADEAGLKQHTRFRAFPTRTVRQDDGTYAVPVYRVTSIHRYGAGEITVHYRVDDEGRAAQWYTSVWRLLANGLEVLPATPRRTEPS